MQEQTESILLGHGSGGKTMHRLIADLFMKHFSNPVLNASGDAAILNAPPEGRPVLTTDSFVVTPIFFPGGDIGRLSVCGTVNDLVASGAIPYCLSAGFIIEEGLGMAELERIVVSMAKTAKEAGVFIATGDTKVVEKGCCDKLFINTTGLGFLAEPRDQPVRSSPQPGDEIIITGYIADHGMAVMAARNQLDGIDFGSDVAPLNLLIRNTPDTLKDIRFMRDPTRGGLATTLCELAQTQQLGVVIHEEKIPVRPGVEGLCDLLGFDPLYVANEGKMLMVVDHRRSAEILASLKNHILGRQASIIGELRSELPGVVRLITKIGGTRIVNMLSGEQLPRIC